jgi:dihydrofolate reductase
VTPSSARSHAPAVVLVAAVASNGVIGTGDAMPWHLPADLRRFKAITLGKPVIMGRRTYDSIGRPLPGRLNIVITRNRDFAPPGVTVVESLAAALAAAGDAAEVCVIGGGEIYGQALPLAARLELTEIALQFEGVTRFPAFDRQDWRETARERHPAGDPAPFAFDFVTYVRADRPPAS